jgi:hypothetical protein
MFLHHIGDDCGDHSGDDEDCPICHQAQGVPAEGTPPACDSSPHIESCWTAPAHLTGPHFSYVIPFVSPRAPPSDFI